MAGRQTLLSLAIGSVPLVVTLLTMAAYGKSIALLYPSFYLARYYYLLPDRFR